MKGPKDWISALAALIHEGVKLDATWFGDGDLLPELQRDCERRGISESVHFVGPRGRDEVLAAVRHAHLFLFCHKTLESPRCVVEALANGTPIVGYDSGYVRDLVASHGGGSFAPMGHFNALAKRVQALDEDRSALANLIEDARSSAETFDRDEAIRKRIELIRTHLTPPERQGVIKEHS